MNESRIMARRGILTAALAAHELAEKSAARSGEDWPEGFPRDLADDYAFHRRLVKWFRKQGREFREWLQGHVERHLLGMLGTDPTIGVPLGEEVPPIADAPEMARAFTPLISSRWDAAGKVTRERLGLDPDEWRVTDPHTKAMIDTASLNFCEATNATTSLNLGTALERLRAELREGIVTAGDSIPELTRRVKSVFNDAETYRAERIARTETSRAVHDASMESARQSGVVSRKKLLVGANACPYCLEIGARFPDGLALDENFDRNESASNAYRDIPNPPLHPHCRCSVTYVLTDEYAAVAEGTELGPLGLAVRRPA